MRHHFMAVLLGTTALAATSAPVFAQSAPPQTQPDPATSTVDDIVVTARRKTESLQDVPTTVTAVTGETVEKLNFTGFQDVSAAVPGLTLNTGPVSSGRVASPSIRGVSYDASTSPSPTVDIYINEVPVSSATAFGAIYDVAGFQVLRGPQGTLRGRTAPSGAILMNTRQANTDEVGGYISGLAATGDTINVQGAVNFPLVQGVLGARLSGVVDQNNYDAVTSANDPRDPYRDTVSGRLSLKFTPTETFRADLEYQRTELDSRQWTLVEGPGAFGGVRGTAPAGYSGPALSASDRKTAGHTPRDITDNNDRVTLNASWDVLGHTLTYVGGYQANEGTTRSSSDYVNALPNADLSSLGVGDGHITTHELRLSSAPGRMFDYSLGYFHSSTEGNYVQDGPLAYLAGTFGSPANPSPFTYNPRYAIQGHVTSIGKFEENSIYGNFTVHLGDRTEITGGGRYIVSKIDNTLRVDLQPSFIAVAVPVPCAFAGLSASPYAGYCDVPIAGSSAQNNVQQNTAKPTVYNVSVSHKFTDDILTYATVGSSWRRGGTTTTIGNSDNDPLLSSLTFSPDETSTAYEVGFKTAWLDRRLRINGAIFHQEFKDLVFQTSSIPYVQSVGTTRSVSATNIVVGADALVDGFDLDVNFRALPNWTLGAAVSYADGHVDDDIVPCRDANFDGVEDTGSPTLAQFTAAGVRVAQCRTSRSVSRDPLWNLSAQSEYFVSLGHGDEAYFRGLLNFYPDNPRANDGYVAPSYTLVNLYAGIRSEDGLWDIGVFARNAFDTGEQTSRDSAYVTTPFDATFGGYGYRFASYTPPRQIGFTIRRAFGGR